MWRSFTGTASMFGLPNKIQLICPIAHSTSFRIRYSVRGICSPRAFHQSSAKHSSDNENNKNQVDYMSHIVKKVEHLWTLPDDRNVSRSSSIEIDFREESEGIHHSKHDVIQVPKIMYDELKAGYFSYVEKATRDKNTVDNKLDRTMTIVWKATARAAIDNFLQKHGRMAVVDYKAIPSAPSVITWHDRSRRIRQQKLSWIFTHKKDEFDVKSLLEAVSSSEAFTTNDEYSDALSRAYDELSDELKDSLIYPNTEYDFRQLVSHQKADIAVSIFLSEFNFAATKVIPKNKSNFDQSSAKRSPDSEKKETPVDYMSRIVKKVQYLWTHTDNRNVSRSSSIEIDFREESEGIHHSKNDIIQVPKIMYDELKAEYFSYMEKATRDKNTVDNKLDRTMTIVWKATAKAAIDDFIQKHGQMAVVDYKAIPSAPSVISWHDRTQRIRQQKLSWIFNNRKDEFDVKSLLEAVSSSEAFVSNDEYSDALSRAYDELSDQLKRSLIYPNTEYDFRHLVSHQKADIAVSVFLSEFNFGPTKVVPKNKSK